MFVCVFGAGCIGDADTTLEGSGSQDKEQPSQKYVEAKERLDRYLLLILDTTDEYEPQDYPLKKIEWEKKQVAIFHYEKDLVAYGYDFPDNDLLDMGNALRLTVSAYVIESETISESKLTVIYKVEGKQKHQIARLYYLTAEDYAEFKPKFLEYQQTYK